MKPTLSLEFVPAPDEEAEAKLVELLDLLADGIARHLLAEARAEAEGALGRPLRTADPGEELGGAVSPGALRRVRSC